MPYTRAALLAEARTIGEAHQTIHAAVPAVLEALQVECAAVGVHPQELLMTFTRTIWPVIEQARRDVYYGFQFI